MRALGAKRRRATDPLSYRPALDGIRALAVVSVVGYHLGLPLTPGGFLGVDIFFVLSGYLITLLLSKEHSTTRIDLGAFWARRARRLFPALLVMVALVAVGIRALRPVTEWGIRKWDLIWTVLYAANWHQISASEDYFAQWRTASPLQHMWSLAIEEQFYVVWPLVLSGLFLWRPRWLLKAVLLASVTSVAAMVMLYQPSSPTRAYVGTDARAFEVLAGAALALVLSGRVTRALPQTDPRGLIGAGAALVVIFVLLTLPDSSPVYYRGGAVVLALAVVSLIWSVETNPTSLVSRVLSVRPLTWLGGVSYGLYLWHWPVILLTPTLLVVLLGASGMALAQEDMTLNVVRLTLAMTVTTLSYYLLERPIRSSRLNMIQKSRVAVAGAASGALALFLVVAVLEVPSDLQGQVAGAESQCETDACVIINSGPGRPVVALLGDSVAKSLDPTFLQLAQNYSWTFVSGAHNRCTVLQHWLDQPNWDSCYASVPRTQALVLSYRPRLIVVSDNWIPTDSLDDAGHVLKSGSPEHVADVERRMDALVEALASDGALVVLMHLVPDSAYLECADGRLQVPRLCEIPASNPVFATYNLMLDRVVERHANVARTIDLASDICPQGLCSAMVDGIYLRFDRLHFSVEGARWLRPRLERRLIAAGVLLEI